MPTYYVSSPDFNIRAEVEAPDTRYARTTYLDYLHRGDLIRYSDRQKYRDRILLKRIRPGEMAGETDVVLDYDMREGVSEVSPPEGGLGELMGEMTPPASIHTSRLRTPGAAPNQSLSVLPTPKYSEVNPQPRSSMQSMTPGSAGAVGKSLGEMILPGGGVRAGSPSQGPSVLPAQGMRNMMPVGNRPPSPVPVNNPVEGEDNPQTRFFRKNTFSQGRY